MNTVRLSNISLSDFRRFPFEKDCKLAEDGTKGRGGHEKWVKDGLKRPITLQTHISPVPEHIVKNTLRDLGFSRKQFEEWYLRK